MRVIRAALPTLAAIAAVAAIAIAAIYLALLVTPAQRVAGPAQPIEVGAVPPSLSISGPAELSIDEQTVRTAVDLIGPVRPHISVSRHTVNSLVAHAEAAPQHRAGLADLGNKIEDGWVHYVIYEAMVVAGAALLLTGLVVGWEMIFRVRAGGKPGRHFWRRRAAAFGICMVAAVALDTSGLPQMPHTLAGVHSLSDLFGSNPAPRITRVGPTISDVQAVVIGDSTAAGAGNPLVNNPTAEDLACRRSRDSYASDLAAATGWKVLNLACSGATIAEGLIGSQHIKNEVFAPQLAVLKQVRSVTHVFVSIGANDLQMGAMVGVCIVLHECSDQAQGALFQAELDGFTHDYSQLLAVLASLPNRPQVVINRYYDGLGNGKCVKGLDAASVTFVRSWFDRMNTTLADGAQLFGFASPQPNFARHQLCDPQPYVQGLSSAAPLHPNVAGELSIALTDLQAGLQDARSVRAPAADGP